MTDAIDLEHLASQLERVLAEQDRIRAEMGSLRDDIDGLRQDIRVLAATLLRIDQWIAAQSAHSGPWGPAGQPGKREYPPLDPEGAGRQRCADDISFFSYPL
jgi:hypothetical protein